MTKYAVHKYLILGGKLLSDRYETIVSDKGIYEVLMEYVAKRHMDDMEDLIGHKGDTTLKAIFAFGNHLEITEVKE